MLTAGELSASPSPRDNKTREREIVNLPRPIYISKVLESRPDGMELCYPCGQDSDIDDSRSKKAVKSLFNGDPLIVVERVQATDLFTGVGFMI